VTLDPNLHAVLDQVFVTRDFRLEGGAMLPELKIAYETYGRLAPDRANVVLLTHGYTSNHHMVGKPGSTLAEGLWNSLVGPGKAIDTDRFLVVSSNMLGSTYGSTGPADLNPLTGRPWGPDFPDITLADIVAAQREMLRHLGIERLVAVVGPSYGGFQAFQWAVSFPDCVEGIVPVTSDFKANAGAAAGVAALMAELEGDPNWNGGDHYATGGVVETMTRMRTGTLVRYGIHDMLAPDFPDPAAREAEIARMARKWAEEFDPNAMIVLGRASARFDLQDCLDRIRARVLFVLCRTDKVFPAALAPGAMARLHQAGVAADYVEIDSELGHAAAGLDGERWAPQLAAFMAHLGRRA